MHKIVAQVQQVMHPHMVVNKCPHWLDLLFMHVIITFNQILNFEKQENTANMFAYKRSIYFHFVQMY